MTGFWRWLTRDLDEPPAQREHTRFCYQPRGECYFLTCTCWCHERGDVTADGWCAAHHCFRTECTYRTHVRTVRCLDALWDKVAAKAAAEGKDTNTGVTAALEAWVASEDAA